MTATESGSSSDREGIINMVLIMVVEEALPGFKDSQTSQEHTVTTTAGNKYRNFNGANENFHRQYFDYKPVYIEADLKKRFQMSRSVLLHLIIALCGRGVFLIDTGRFK